MRHLSATIAGSDNQEVLSRLRACLQTFEGSRAFHNYTKRRLYRLPAKPSKSSGEPDSGTHQAAAPAPFAASSQEAAGQAAAGERAQRTTSKPQKHERRFSASTDGLYLHVSLGLAVQSGMHWATVAEVAMTSRFWHEHLRSPILQAVIRAEDSVNVGCPIPL